MNSSHTWLAVGWICFCFLHSLLAAPLVKKKIERIFGKYGRNYRIFYSLFAGLSLVAVLIYQFSIQSPRLFVLAIGGMFVAGLFCITGLVIMAYCIRKYFFYVSGVEVFTHEVVKPVLQKDGLHQYVRHPLYLGTLVFIWSLFFLFPYLNNLIACIVISMYTLVGIRFEERKLLGEFGNAYEEYQRTVPMLFPRRLFQGKNNF